jgi:heat shock protein HtpX
MIGMRNRELFPSNRSLMVRMVAVSIATPLMVLALLVALFVVLPSTFAVGVLIVGGVGVLKTLGDARRATNRVVLSERDAPELFATVDRLCAIANVPRPEIVLEQGREPNSWIIAPPRRTPQLHVTQSLLDLLDPNELQAVLAHEISHIANRDATVMTVVGIPGAVLLAGAKSRGGRGTMWFGGLWLWIARWIAAAIGRYSQFGTNTLSRYRELSADQGAAAITGRPSALASALIKVSGKVQAVPHTDLRAMAALDGFHFVAVGEEAREGLFGRLGATHPSLEQRLRALEKLEAHAQHARPSLTD